jgi:hypothetical protein
VHCHAEEEVKRFASRRCLAAYFNLGDAMQIIEFTVYADDDCNN